MFDFQKKLSSCLVKVFNLNKKQIRVRKQFKIRDKR